ncbi:hypothetical protein V5O48_002178 [Marasmius crinis-equi]|uniref:F-box domain-containing protein n=1 Tax=Marasmius crinis-equi TaxID=585013 RepID=A0ABR3FWA9_9AGAR
MESVDIAPHGVNMIPSRSTVTALGREMIMESIRAAENQLHNLYAQTHSLQNELNKVTADKLIVESRCRTVEDEIVHWKSLLAPIHRIAPETIIHIFELCCAGNNLTASGPSIRHTTPRLLVLSAVCARWRDLALGTPSLWTSFAVDVHGHCVSPTSLYCLTRLFIDRSRNLLLDMRVGYAIGDENNAYDFFQLLANNSRRWCSLALKITTEASYQSHFENIRGEVPELQKLALTFAGVGPATVGDFLLRAFEDAPSLHTLDLDMELASTGVLIPWSQIKDIKLRSGHVHDTLNILSKLPMAEHVSVEVLFQDQEAFVVPEVCLPKVKSLSFCIGTEPRSDADGALTDLLKHCTFSTLESLSITQLYPPMTQAWDEPWKTGCIRDLIHRSSCSLTTLHICYVPIADFDLVSILELTPALVTLHVLEGFPETYYIGNSRRKNITITSHFLRRLSVHWHETFEHAKTRFVENIIVPRLQHLELNVYYTDLDQALLINAIVSRCPSTDRLDRQLSKNDGISKLQSWLRSVKLAIQVDGDRQDTETLFLLLCFKNSGVMVDMNVVQETVYDVAEIDV